MTSRRKANFVPDHHYRDPAPQVDTERIHTTDEDVLFAFGDQPPVRVPEPDDLPPAMPEVLPTTDGDPIDVVEALKRVVKAFNMAGKNAGREKHTKTFGSRFASQYTAEPGNDPKSMAEWMDGKEIGLMVGVGLASYDKPEHEKTRAEKAIEAEGLQVLDALNGTTMRIADGEPTTEVLASRKRLAGWLLHDLSPGAKYRVDAGYKEVDASYRNRLYEQPDVGMAFLSRLRLRSR